MGKISAVRLEERYGITYEILQAARVVQELANGDALRERRGVTVEAEQPFLDELKDERCHEDLRHAPDPEAVIDRKGLARATSASPAAASTRPAGADGYRHRARNTGRDDGIELIRDRFHPLDRQPIAGAKRALGSRA